MDEFKFLVSLDPSFTRTGICIIDLINKHIYFSTASCKIGEKQFENVAHAAQSVTSQIKSEIYRICNDKFVLIMESPLPMSSMSSALYGLDTLIYDTFNGFVRQTYNPATLMGRIHGHKYDKKDSQLLADKYLNILKQSGYIIVSDIGVKKKIPHDCCEALLYAHLYLHDNNHRDFQFDNKEDIKAYKLRMKRLKEKEKEIMSSEEI